MTSTPIIARSATTSAEVDLHFHFSNLAFSSNPSEEVTQRWKNFVLSQPGYRPEMLRAVFRNGEQVGSCFIFERKLRMGTAELTTGCIGAVVTYPDHRKQGVASALMLDAIDYARAHQYSLLQLDGIPMFYYRYGYTDMFDVTTQDINYHAIMTLPASSYTVRPATVDDAEDLLALYQRYYGSYSSSYVRSLDWQRYNTLNNHAENPVFLALDETGAAKGYLILGRASNRAFGAELAVDDWQATTALLQHHARLLEGPEAPAFLTYPLPSTSETVQQLVDVLVAPDSPEKTSPAVDWAVRSQSLSNHFGGWMACLIHLPTLVQELLPEWRARWQRSLVGWSGDLRLEVGEETCGLRIDGDELSLLDGPGIASDVVRLTPQDFVQVLFGYRSVATFLRRSGQAVPDDLLTVLNVLFPSGHTWIPSSDWF